jgi:hypothetical protein
MSIGDVASAVGAAASALTLLIAVYASWKVLLREGRNKRRIEAYLQKPVPLSDNPNDEGKRTDVHIARYTGIPIAEVSAAAFRSRKIDITVKEGADGFAQRLLFHYAKRPKRFERSARD